MVEGRKESKKLNTFYFVNSSQSLCPSEIFAFEFISKLLFELTNTNVIIILQQVCIREISLARAKFPENV